MSRSLKGTDIVLDSTERSPFGLELNIALIARYEKKRGIQALPFSKEHLKYIFKVVHNKLHFIIRVDA